MQTVMQTFIERAAILLQEMVIPEDGNKPIHLVVLESLNPNAMFFKLNSGEKVVAINLGLLNTVENDEELAFIFGHELEHGRSDLQEKVNSSSQRDLTQATLLKRTVENEVDVRSVERMINKGKSPHAASDWLRRIKETYGDDPGVTHTMLTTRYNIVDGAIAAKVRVQGVSTEHRLDRSARSTGVIAKIKQDVLKNGKFLTYLLEKIERLVTPEGVVDGYYDAIRNNIPERFPIEPYGNNNHGREEKISIFDSIFRSRWNQIERILPPSVDGARRVEYQLKLAKNLNAEFERSKAKHLDADFVPFSSEHFEAMVLLEKRAYSLDVPNLVGKLRRRDSLKKSIANAEIELASLDSNKDEITLKNRLKHYNKLLRSIEQDIEIAQSLFEKGAELNQFIAEGYKRANEYNFRPSDNNFTRQLEETGLRIREIHDLFVDAPKRERAARSQGQLYALLIPIT